MTRIAAGLTLALFAIALVSGLAMRTLQLRPEGLASWDVYGGLFSTHAGTLLPLILSVLFSLSLREPSQRPSLGWASLAAIGISLLASMVLVSATWPQDALSRSLLLTLPLLLAATLVASHIFVQAHAASWTAPWIGLAGAAALLPFGLAVGPLAAPQLSAPSALYTILTLFSPLASGVAQALAIAATAQLLDDGSAKPARSSRVLVIVLLVAAVLPALVAWLRALPVLASLIAGGWLALRVARQHCWRAYPAFCALTFFEALIMTQVLATLSDDVHLFDTTFVAASFHLKLATVILAGLALTEERTDFLGREMFGLVEVVLVVAGSHVFHFGLLLLGVRGMPRRYSNYLPEFEPLQIAVSLGAALFALGLLLAAVRRFRGGRGRARAELP